LQFLWKAKIAEEYEKDSDASNAKNNLGS